jgi:hypothetical protein
MKAPWARIYRTALAALQEAVMPNKQSNFTETP